MQEWNRQPYGIQDILNTHAAEINLWFEDNTFEIIYLTRNGALPDLFASNKTDLLKKLLDMDALFKKGFSVKTESIDKITPLGINLTQADTITPRPLLENLEKLAIAIHKLYNQQKMERYPDQLTEWPSFSDLPDTLKYSNLRQARSIMEKLQLMNWTLRPMDSPGKKIEKIETAVVETLAMFEHKAWMEERLSTGWKYGPEKNVDEKISPYLIPYEALPEQIKEFDRNTVRNIPELLDMIGMAIYQVES